MTQERTTRRWHGRTGLSLRSTTRAGVNSSLSINVPHSERGHLSGLLGNDNGRAADEFRTSTGITLANPPAGKELYGEYSNSWRVTPADSLFTYGPDQSTSTFTNLAFPYSPVDVASLSEPDRKAGISICRSEGVRAEPFLDACVLDVAETGDGVVAAGAAAAESFDVWYGNQSRQKPHREPLSPGRWACCRPREPASRRDDPCWVANRRWRGGHRGPYRLQSRGRRLGASLRLP